MAGGGDTPTSPHGPRVLVWARCLRPGERGGAGRDPDSDPVPPDPPQGCRTSSAVPDRASPDEPSGRQRSATSEWQPRVCLNFSDFRGGEVAQIRKRDSERIILALGVTVTDSLTGTRCWVCSQPSIPIAWPQQPLLYRLTWARHGIVQSGPSLLWHLPWE